MVENKKQASSLLGKRIVEVTFRRFKTTAGTTVPEPTIHLSDGSRLMFSVHELDNGYAVSMYRLNPPRNEK